MKVLYIDSCVNRSTSRTEHLAQSLLKSLKGELTTVVLEDLNLRPHNAEALANRAAAASEGRFDDECFRLGRQFKEADVVVISSPFWEMSFNGMTKLYLEHISQLGLTFRYDENGLPVGLTSIKRLYYVTTRGGLTSDESDLGFQNIRAVAGMFGITDVRILSANGLDIIGNNPADIIREAESKITEIVRRESRDFLP